MRLVPDFQSAAPEWWKLSTDGQSASNGNTVRECPIEDDENRGGRVWERGDDDRVTGVIAENGNRKGGGHFPRARG